MRKNLEIAPQTKNSGPKKRGSDEPDGPVFIEQPGPYTNRVRAPLRSLLEDPGGPMKIFLWGILCSPNEDFPGSVWLPWKWEHRAPYNTRVTNTDSPEQKPFVWGA